MEEILRLFPEAKRHKLQYVLRKRWINLQEIRIRLGQTMELIFNDKVERLDIRTTKQDCIFMINQLSEFSLYRMEDELREGFITIEGGHRVGLAGKVNTLKGTVKAIQYITFLNIRIAKAHEGVASTIMPYIYNDTYLNTIFIGPPQTGKTTLIRDVTRMISNGWGHVAPHKVGIVDERSEIAGSIKGIPQHNIGMRTDVMDACPKAEGMMMFIRSMSPEIIVVDEIGSHADVAALLEAIHAGVTVICTVHGASLDELQNRPSLQPVFKQRIFQRAIILERHAQPGYIKQIFNHKQENILKKSRC